jgi:hypothetical protein
MTNSSVVCFISIHVCVSKESYQLLPVAVFVVSLNMVNPSVEATIYRRVLGATEVSMLYSPA